MNATNVILESKQRFLVNIITDFNAYLSKNLTKNLIFQLKSRTKILEKAWNDYFDVLLKHSSTTTTTTSLKDYDSRQYFSEVYGSYHRTLTRANFKLIECESKVSETKDRTDAKGEFWNLFDEVNRLLGDVRMREERLKLKMRGVDGKVVEKEEFQELVDDVLRLLESVKKDGRVAKE